MLPKIPGIITEPLLNFTGVVCYFDKLEHFLQCSVIFFQFLSMKLNSNCTLFLNISLLSSSIQTTIQHFKSNWISAIIFLYIIHKSIKWAQLCVIMYTLCCWCRDHFTNLFQVDHYFCKAVPSIYVQEA